MKDYLENDSGWKAGDRVLAFDSVLWDKNGGDADDNRIFYKPATILEVYREEPDEFNQGELRMLAKLDWDHKEPTSGHFLYCLERL